jgi:hypothetical protein
MNRKPNKNGNRNYGIANKWWQNKALRKWCRCAALILGLASAIFLYFALSVNAAKSMDLGNGIHASVQYGNMPGAYVSSEHPAFISIGWVLLILSFFIQLLIEVTEEV